MLTIRLEKTQKIQNNLKENNNEKIISKSQKNKTKESKKMKIRKKKEKQKLSIEKIGKE